MQRCAFIREFSLKPFSLKARDPETTCPSHSLCCNCCVNNSVDEGNLRNMGRKKDYNDPARGRG